MEVAGRMLRPKKWLPAAAAAMVLAAGCSSPETAKPVPSKSTTTTAPAPASTAPAQPTTHLDEIEALSPHLRELDARLSTLQPDAKLLLLGHEACDNLVALRQSKTGKETQAFQSVLQWLDTTYVVVQSDAKVKGFPPTLPEEMGQVCPQVMQPAETG